MGSKIAIVKAAAALADAYMKKDYDTVSEKTKDILGMTMKGIVKDVHIEESKIQISHETLEQVMKPIIPLLYKPQHPCFRESIELLECLLAIPRESQDPLQIEGLFPTRFVNTVKQTLRAAMETKNPDQVRYAHGVLYIYYDIFHPTKVDFQHVIKDILQFHHLFIPYMLGKHLFYLTKYISRLEVSNVHMMEYIALCRSIRSTHKDKSVLRTVNHILTNVYNNSDFLERAERMAAELIAEEEKQKSKKPSKSKKKAKPLPRLELSDSDEEIGSPECFVEAECVICMEKVPEVTFDCKHRICCTVCAEKIKQRCPYCLP